MISWLWRRALPRQRRYKSACPVHDGAEAGILRISRGLTPPALSPAVSPEQLSEHRMTILITGANSGFGLFFFSKRRIF